MEEEGSDCICVTEKVIARTDADEKAADKNVAVEKRTMEKGGEKVVATKAILVKYQKGSRKALRASRDRGRGMHRAYRGNLGRLFAMGSDVFVFNMF